MDNIVKMGDKYSAKIENVLVILDFSLEVHENDLVQLVIDYYLYSLQKA